MNSCFLPCKQSLGPVNCGWIIAHLAGGHPASFHPIMLKRPGTEPNKPSPFPFPSAGTSSRYDAKVNSCCEYCFHIPLALSCARMIPFLREISVCSETMAGIGGRNQSTRGLQSTQGVLPGWILPRFLLQTWRDLKSKAENGRSEDKMIQGKNEDLSCAPHWKFWKIKPQTLGVCGGLRHTGTGYCPQQDEGESQERKWERLR